MPIVNWNECLEALYWGANKNGQGGWNAHKQAIAERDSGNLSKAQEIIVSLNQRMRETYEDCQYADAKHFWNLLSDPGVFNPNGPT